MSLYDRIHVEGIEEVLQTKEFGCQMTDYHIKDGMLLREVLVLPNNADDKEDFRRGYELVDYTGLLLANGQNLQAKIRFFKGEVQNVEVVHISEVIEESKAELAEMYPEVLGQEGESSDQ